MDRDYITTVLTEYKLLGKKQQSIAQDIERWKHRKLLATQKGAYDLEAAADKKINEKMETVARVKEARDTYEKELQRIKLEEKNLQGKKGTGPDPKELLQQLQKITGEDALLKQELDNLSAEKELERLKKELDT